MAKYKYPEYKELFELHYQLLSVCRDNSKEAQ